MPPIYRRAAPSALLSIAAFIAVLPMLRSGPSCGHDFDFHLVSWLEAANQLAHFGYPHWAYTPAFNAGEPRFIFYPPLSWTLGALLGLILPWNLVPIAFTWIALTLSGLTMHALARRYAVPNAALLAATLYLANPYMLFNAYERTAYGELLAAAFVPLLFAAILEHRPRIQRIAIALALIWLANVPAGVMSSYALALLVVIRLCTPAFQPGAGRSGAPSPPFSLRHAPGTRPALTAFCGAVLGLALAGFYLVPAVFEQRFVQPNLALIVGMRISDNTLFHRMTPATTDNLAHNVVLHTVSVLAMVLLGVTLFAAAVHAALGTRRLSSSLHFSRRAAQVEVLTPLLLLALAISFLFTPLSLPVWAHLPELRFLQFPWRLLTLLAPITALYTAALVPDHPPRRGILLFPLLLTPVLVFPCWHLFAQRCLPEDTPKTQVTLFHSSLGTDPTDEYTPVTANGDEPVHDPPYWLLPLYGPPSFSTSLGSSPIFSPASDDLPSPIGAAPGLAPAHLTLNLTQPQYLVLNRRQYPIWQVRINGEPPLASPSPHSILQALRNSPPSLENLRPLPGPAPRTDGLIVLILPAGRSTVDLVQIHTPDQTAGLILSVLAALLAIILGRRAQGPGPGPVSPRI